MGLNFFDLALSLSYLEASYSDWMPIVENEEDYLVYIEYKLRYQQRVREVLFDIPKDQLAYYLSKLPTDLAKEAAAALRGDISEAPPRLR